MAKKLEHTPRSKIKAAIRRLWLGSRERSAAIKRDKYTCQQCGLKQSRVKGHEKYVEVHHKGQIDWDAIYKIIYERVLVHPDNMETLCKECHEKITESQKAASS